MLESPTVACLVSVHVSVIQPVGIRTLHAVVFFLVRFGFVHHFLHLRIRKDSDRDYTILEYGFQHTVLVNAELVDCILGNLNL